MTDEKGTAFVGRQPIYSPDLKVAAYELLFRDAANQSSVTVTNPDHATAAVILSTFAEVGLNNLVGPHPAFLNVTQNFLLQGHAYALPHERVVLELLEDIEPTPEVIAAVAELSDSGYRIALDDFVYEDRLLPLIELADIVKVELPAIDEAELPRHVEILRNSNAQLLAEKVETYAEFELCKELGFDLFQGYFFARPRVISHEKTPSNRISALRLLGRLQSPDVTTAELVRILSSEPTLCYRILRWVNSATNGLSRAIESVSDAINLIGLRRLHALASLCLLTEAGDEKPAELIATSLVRGRMCELLATQLRRAQPETYFMAGLFSTLDAILDKPMEEAVRALSLSGPLTQAIVEHTGPFADVLECVLHYEHGQWTRVEIEGLDNEAIRLAYLQAITWTSESTAQLVEN